MKAQYLSVPRQSKTSRAIDLATSDGHSSRMALRYELISCILHFIEPQKLTIFFISEHIPGAATLESNTDGVSDEESQDSEEDNNPDDNLNGDRDTESINLSSLPVKRKAVLEEPMILLCADDDCRLEIMVIDLLSCDTPGCNLTVRKCTFIFSLSTGKLIQVILYYYSTI